MNESVIVLKVLKNKSCSACRERVNESVIVQKDTMIICRNKKRMSVHVYLADLGAQVEKLTFICFSAA